MSATVDAAENPYDVGPDGPIYLTTEELADRFRMTPSGVRDMRARGEGPLGVVFARRVLYPLPAVVEFEAARIADAERAQARRANPLAAVESLSARGSAAPRRLNGKSNHRK